MAQRAKRCKEIYADLAVAENVRESTRSQYAKRLKQLERICKADILTVIEHPYDYIGTIKVAISSPGARANAIAVILATLKHCNIPEASDEIREGWSSIHVEEQAPAVDAFTSGEKKTDVMWSSIFMENDALYHKAVAAGATRHDVSDALLSMFYVDIEPRRQEDYMRLFVKRNQEKSLETSYVDIGPKRAVLHVEKYKTSKSLKPWVKELPERLDKILRLSLALDPRDYVFVGRDGQPYKTPGAWAKHHNSKLSKWYGPGTNVLAMRHARATSVNQDPRYSAKQRAEIARDMGHRLATNMAYAHVEETEEAPDGSFTVSRYSKNQKKFIEYGCKPVVLPK